MKESASEPRFINRELSWIEFNARVLDEALRADVPLLERLKFLCIVTSNFDEFFMVRVAALKRQVEAGDHVQCPSGLRPSQVLARVFDRVRELVRAKYTVLVDDILPALADNGIRLRRTGGYTSAQSAYLKTFFHEEVFPILTPVRVGAGDTLPYVTNLRLHAVFLLEKVPGTATVIESVGGGAPQASPNDSVTGKDPDDLVAIVQIPTSLDRIVDLPDDTPGLSFALMEDIIIHYAPSLFPGYRIIEHCVLRVTRDADMGVDEERDEDFVEAMEQIIARRDFSSAVRLSVSLGSGRLRGILSRAVGVPDDEVFDKAEPLDIGELMGLTGLPGFDALRYPIWHGYQPSALPADEPVWDAIKRHDVFIHHPFERFDPVIRLLQDAADDDDVLAIKMTLYRTSGDSPVVRALERAAMNGKHVTVLVEIKARFDEERNITWAERLQEAGVIVVHGIAKLKVHAKAMLIVRREQSTIQRYVHLGTGNYNDRTARLYTDIALLTARPEIAYDTGLFFNAITGYSAIPALNTLVMAPVGMKAKIIQLIDRETIRAGSGIQSRILAKLNSLADSDVIEALYRASQAGVEVRLNVRGVCMLIPGVPGLSENITVISIIDRYLEHARLLYVHNGGAGEVYASSADWMPRNLERRVELMFPISDPDARSRAIQILDTAFADTAQSHLMQPDGSFRRLSPGKRPAVRSQEVYQQRARDHAASSESVNRREFDVRRTPPKG
ncbi:MAG: polyphosphate kinase 1 [Spirochaetaceae bacterium]|nr:MAG: polyphosphate kinase 1 [Spirochaetaceae bacterium]